MVQIGALPEGGSRSSWNSEGENLVFEQGCAVGGRQGQRGSSRGFGWTRKDAQKILWCFLVATIVGGVLFGYIRGSGQGNALRNEPKKGREESRSALELWDDQGVQDAEDQDVRAGR